MTDDGGVNEASFTLGRRPNKSACLKRQYKRNQACSYALGKVGSCSKVLERQGHSRLAHTKVFRRKPSATWAELYAAYLIRDEIFFIMNFFRLFFVDFDSEEDALHQTLKGLLSTKRFH